MLPYYHLCTLLTVSRYISTIHRNDAMHMIKGPSLREVGIYWRYLTAESNVQFSAFFSFFQLFSAFLFFSLFTPGDESTTTHSIPSHLNGGLEVDTYPCFTPLTCISQTPWCPHLDPADSRSVSVTVVSSGPSRGNVKTTFRTINGR